MTVEQKQCIIQMRKQHLGYMTIAKELAVSINTVKSFCRRNRLSGEGADSGTEPAIISERNPQIDLINPQNRGNSGRAKSAESLEKTGLSGCQPVCEATISFAEHPDETAMKDVLALLMNADYRR